MNRYEGEEENELTWSQTVRSVQGFCRDPMHPFKGPCRSTLIHIRGGGFANELA
jgi:hypothetical protein